MKGYLDTVKENAERIRKARNKINNTAIAMLLGFAFLTLTGLYAHYKIIWGYDIFLFAAVIYLILGVGLIIKREIYSVMIFLKEGRE